MNKMFVLFFKELKSIFYSPVIYVVGAIFSILNGYTFWIILNLLNDPNGQISDSIIELFFGGTMFFWIGVLIIIPMLTMKTISEEKKSGTIELLFTAPITDFTIVIAKFLSLIVFYLFLWIPTLFYILFIKMYGPIDINTVFTAYVGLILLGAVMISLGILFSAITQNQIIAAILTFAVLLIMFSIGFLKFFIKVPMINQFFDYIWLIGHFEDFSKGILDLRRIVYYSSLVIFNLFLATQLVGSRNWKN